MSQWSPQLGATLSMPSGPAHDPAVPHLFICLTDPVGDDKLVLMVCVTSVKDGVPYDESCILEYQEHDSITHKSWVFYRAAKITSLEKIMNGIAKGVFRPREPVSDEVFEKIEQGLKMSPFTSPRNLNFFCNRP